MESRNIMIVGTGAMGSGIAQVCALSGHAVTLYDASDEMVEKAMASISWSLGKLADKNRLNEEKEIVLKRIGVAKNCSEAGNADFVIEAIVENIEVKKSVFEEINNYASDKTILATNTSSIPVTEIAAAVKAPERFVGIHFFNPVHRMQLVEIVKGVATSEETVNASVALAKSLGKEPVVVNKDTAGFIVNRINGMAFLEAIRLYEKGVASVEDIDKAVKLGLGYPLGPFELMDMVGLDVVEGARKGIYEETREPLHFPPTTLTRLVKAGHLGRKTGKGFYEY